MKDGGPAFPESVTSCFDGQICTSTGYGVGGMSRRQWLAGLAMQGFCSNPRVAEILNARGTNAADEIMADVALFSYTLADAMLAYEAQECRRVGEES
jgi:hypothetical protein